MKLPWNAENFDEADSVLGRRTAPSPIKLAPPRSRPPVATAPNASVARPQFRGRWKHLDAPAISSRLDWRELLVTAAAWLVTGSVLIALVYLAYSVYRYAQPL